MHYPVGGLSCNEIRLRYCRINRPYRHLVPGLRTVGTQVGLSVGPRVRFPPGSVVFIPGIRPHQRTYCLIPDLSVLQALEDRDSGSEEFIGGRVSLEHQVDGVSIGAVRGNPPLMITSLVGGITSTPPPPPD